MSVLSSALFVCFAHIYKTVDLKLLIVGKHFYWIDTRQLASSCCCCRPKVKVIALPQNCSSQAVDAWLIVLQDGCRAVGIFLL